MKVGILTHPLTNNYGGILQNYALQSVIREMGHEPITLDYRTSMPLKNIIASYASRLIKNLRGGHYPLRGWPTWKEQEVINQQTRKFIKSNIATTKSVDIKDLGLLSRLDWGAIVVGSDQVWRGNNRYIKKFFLSDFENINIPKIAYAVSFGVDSWNYTKRETIECAKLAKKFKYISVRENSAQQLCKSHLDINAEWVLDPTFLIEREKYEMLVRLKYPNISSHKKMMVYVLDKSEKKREIVNLISKSLSLTQNEVMAKKKFSEVGSEGLNDCVFPSVEEWLKGFIESEFVVTDSFHGTVFSIIFNKPFLTMTNNSRGNSRLVSLLSSLHLQDRLVNESTENVERIINSSINYEEINTMLSSWKNESIQFLKRGLQ